jgi:hypothetical protein
MAEFWRQLNIRCTPAFRDAVERAAARELSNASDYGRRAILKQLARDGINVTTPHDTMCGRADCEHSLDEGCPRCDAEYIHRLGGNGTDITGDVPGRETYADYFRRQNEKSND